MQQKALTRQQTYNKKAKEVPIKIGAKVVRKNHLPGRNKIQDEWDSTPYIVVARPQDNVYSIQLADGVGQIMNVTRTEILEIGRLDDFKFSKFNDEVPTSPESTDSESEGHLEVFEKAPIVPGNEVGTPFESTDPMESTDTFDKAEEKLLPEVRPKQGQVTEKLAPEVKSNKVPLRRTSRTTAGKHSNPYHLPKSVLESTSVTAGTNFQDFGHAVALLGESLGNTLGKTLQVGWMNMHQVDSEDE